MVEQILQRRWNAVIVLAADDGEGVRSSIDLRQLLQNTRGGAGLVFLVHAVKEWQVVFRGIDDADRVAAPPKRGFEEVDEPDTGARFAHGSIENCDVQRHGGFLGAMRQPMSPAAESAVCLDDIKSLRRKSLVRAESGAV